MREKTSIIKKFSLKKILFFCLLLIGLDVLNFFRFQTIKYSLISAKVWFPFAIGILLALTAALRIKDRKEKIGIILFGIAFVLGGLANLLNHRVIILFSISLEILAINSFYLFFRDNQAVSKS